MGVCAATRSSEAASRPHREVTTKRVTSFTTSDRSESPATDNHHMDGKMPPYGQSTALDLSLGPKVEWVVGR